MLDSDCHRLAKPFQSLEQETGKGIRALHYELRKRKMSGPSHSSPRGNAHELHRSKDRSKLKKAMLTESFSME